MDLKDIMLSEISQTKKDRYYDLSHTCNLKKKRGVKEISRVWGGRNG